MKILSVEDVRALQIGETVELYSCGKRILNISEVARYVGRRREWVTEHLGVTAEGITAMALARKLAKDFS